MYNLMFGNKVDVSIRANIIMSVHMVNNVIIRSGVAVIAYLSNNCVVVSVTARLTEYKEVSN